MSSLCHWEWDGKAEPSSPHFSDHDDIWLFEDNLTKDLMLAVDSKLGVSSSDSLVQSKAELAQQLLNELEQIKEEPFSQWLEEKIDLPLFEDLSMETAISITDVSNYPKCPPHYNITAPQQHQHQHDTQSLLREFEYVYDKVELNHLTPPQSPPASSSSNASFYTQQVVGGQQDTYTNLMPPVRWEETPYPKQEQLMNSQQPPRHQVDDVMRELADVEELVRRRAQDFIPADTPDLLPCCRSVEDDSSSAGAEEESGVASPASSTSSSDRDEDWIPQVTAVRSGRAGRGKPYARPPGEERKNRKKEQNKNAATRYRQKKKAQIEEILGEERGLLDRNDELKTQCADVEREIKYLKGLMRDLFKAKGLI